jgi:hypothetical protein
LRFKLPSVLSKRLHPWVYHTLKIPTLLFSQPMVVPRSTTASIVTDGGVPLLRHSFLELWPTREPSDYTFAQIPLCTASNSLVVRVAERSRLKEFGFKGIISQHRHDSYVLGKKSLFVRVPLVRPTCCCSGEASRLCSGP